jgi:hypothetical protein
MVQVAVGASAEATARGVGRTKTAPLLTPRPPSLCCLAGAPVCSAARETGLPQWGFELSHRTGDRGLTLEPASGTAR